MDIVLLVVLVAAVLLVVFFIVTYNRLVRERLGVREGWSGIEVQLQRRASLVPNLVETVKGYAAHEQTTFQNVTNARSMLQSATTPAGAAQADNMLTSALRSLFAVSEAYPDLQANENFQDLQRQLADTEDKISYSRNYYTATVRSFNGLVSTFPSMIVAGVGNFQEAEFFDAPETAQEDVKVSFQ
jgi:LemA protein